ncbi:MlaC/ttg2D family ABC transporter substrate-binding protein [Pseudomonas oryzihabitans]|uniref:MlaC/ttg2D family ABC transporter substrate-binding protein n=1 Tax=Pseudomonas oryzihabitans TaxID=47885 RepID=UPI00135EB5CB|nr:ABC transporter substrate-binding protein [Pseudomonas oryzihabitans]MXS21561.1 hypothetical protein [Pseudomonas oryzihabitans]
MNRTVSSLLAVVTSIALSASPAAAETHAAGSPAALVREVTTHLVAAARANPDFVAGDVEAIATVVDDVVLPAVDFPAATRSAVGPRWREASPAQRQRLQEAFERLLVRFYANGIRQIREYDIQVTETLAIPNRPDQVIVRSRVTGNGEVHTMDYRLTRRGDTWKVIDVSVEGIWITLSYRSQFAGALARGGIEELIRVLEAPARAGQGA